MTEPTIFIVDDEPAVRNSLSLLLRVHGMQAETFATARAFLDAFDPARPGCIVADIRMPEMSGLDLQCELNRRGATAPIIMITGHGDVAMAVTALKGGAADFIEKPIDDQRLIDSIAMAVNRDARARDERDRVAEISARIDRLSPREREVFARLVKGQPNKVIADRLGISVRTVEVYRANVMAKMQASGLSALIRMGIEFERVPGPQQSDT